MSHRQTDRRHNVPHAQVNYVHTAEEMQSAITEIAYLEQEIIRLTDSDRPKLVYVAGLCTCECEDSCNSPDPRTGMLLCLLSAALVASLIFYLVWTW